MKEPAKNWLLSDWVLKFLELWFVIRIQLFKLLRTMVTNLKNCPDNRQGYGPIPHTDPTLV